MRRMLFLLCLVTPPLWAAEGTVLVIERTEPNGASLLLAQMELNARQWTFGRLARLPLLPIVTYGFAFGDPNGPLTGHLFTTWSLTSRTGVFGIAGGQWTQLKDWANLNTTGLGAFAPNEVIGWLESKGALVHLTDVGWQKVSDDHFIGPAQFYDVRVARIDRNRVAFIAYNGNNGPLSFGKADYDIFILELEPNRKATVRTSGSLPDRLPNTMMTFTPDGVIYVSDDGKTVGLTYLAYNQLNVPVPLMPLRVTRGTPVMPLGPFSGAGKPGITVRLGDDLHFFSTDGNTSAVLHRGIFADSNLDAALAPKGAPAGRNVIVAAQAITGVDTTPYFQIFGGQQVMAYGNPPLRDKLVARLSALVGPLPEKLPALPLVHALNRDAMGTDWFVQLLNDLPLERRRHHHLDTRGGMYFHQPPPTAMIVVKELVDELLTSAKCGVLLAAQ